MDRRVRVAEVPFVGRQWCPFELHIPFSTEEAKLVLRCSRVDVGERHTLEGEIPRREPRSIPTCRAITRKIMAVQVPPLAVRVLRAERLAAAVRSDRLVATAERRSDKIARSRPTLRTPGARSASSSFSARRSQRRIVFVRFLAALGERQVKICALCRRRRLHLRARGEVCSSTRSPGASCEAMPARHLRSVLRGVYCRRPSGDVIVDAILREWRSSGDPEQAGHICLVVAEEEFWEASSWIGPRDQTPSP